MLYTGPEPMMTLAEARLFIGTYLGIPPIRVHPRLVPEADLLEAVSVALSYMRVKYILERDELPPLGPPDLNEIRELMEKKHPSRPKHTKITPDNLWKKPAY